MQGLHQPELPDFLQNGMNEDWKPFRHYDDLPEFHSLKTPCHKEI